MSTATQQRENLFDMSQVGASAVGVVASAADLCLVEQLRNGNEAAFVWLVDRYHTTMLHVAKLYVTAWSVAEEVVQEAWVGILEGLYRFEGRSSLRTWMFRILTNCAITRAQREGRSIPFSSLSDHDADLVVAAVDPECFALTDLQQVGQWISFSSNRHQLPDERLLSQETRAYLGRAIETLPSGQREVIILRDIEGWTSEETCHVLGVTEGNQRVLLHRARSKVRGMLEQYFSEE